MENHKGGFRGNSWHVGSVEKCSYLAVWQGRYECGRTDEVLSHYLRGDSMVYCVHFFQTSYHYIYITVFIYLSIYFLANSAVSQVCF